MLGLFKNPRSFALRKLFGRSLVFPASYDPDLAEAVAEFAYARRDIYDLILLTGDIATTGLDDDLAPAFEFVDKAAVQYWLTADRKPSLQGTGRQVFLLPGNHDRYDDNIATAGGLRFDVMFQRYWRTTNQRVQRIVIRKKSDGQRLALIAADFSLARSRDAQSPTRLNRYGQGRAYASRVNQLVNVTNQTRKEYKNVVVIWVMHFPPLPAEKQALNLIDHSNVQNAAINCNVPLIVAGHVHRPGIDSFGGVHVWSAGSATSVDTGHGNWVHILDFEITNGSLKSFTRTDYHWDQSQQIFDAV